MQTIPRTPFLLLAACALLGCEHADSEKGVSWNGSGKQPAAVSSSSSSSDSAAAQGDMVDFSALAWSYGGFNGGGAQPSAVTITGLSMSPNSLSFGYVNDLSSWGLGHSEAGALCCLFVQQASGAWVGGKFDWISSSRTTRDLAHVKGGYNGWSLRGCANPCPVAFVIVSGDGSKRSNVITSTWKR